MDVRHLHLAATLISLAGVGVLLARSGHYRRPLLVAGIGVAAAPAFVGAYMLADALLHAGAPYPPALGPAIQAGVVGACAAAAFLTHAALARARWWLPVVAVLALVVLEFLVLARYDLYEGGLALGVLPLVLGITVARVPRERPARVPRAAPVLLVVGLAFTVIAVPWTLMILTWGPPPAPTEYAWRVTVTPVGDAAQPYALRVPFPAPGLETQDARVTNATVARVLDGLRERTSAEGGTVRFPARGGAVLDAAGSATVTGTYAFHGGWGYRSALEGFTLPAPEVVVEGPDGLRLHVEWEFRVQGLNCLPAHVGPRTVTVAPGEPARVLPDGVTGEALGQWFCQAHGD